MEESVLVTAKRELCQLLQPIYTGAWDELDIRLEVDPSKSEGEVRVDAAPNRIYIVGASEADVLYGVYNYLEQLGFVFTVNGPVPPDRPVDMLVTLSKTWRPYLKHRGIRQHLDFPMDISSYPLWEAREYIRNLARMRFNTITFHTYLLCGWYHLDMPEVGDAFAKRKSSIHDYTYFFSEYHPVPTEPHLCAVIRNESTFCPPEVEHQYGTREARGFAYRFLRELIGEAKRFGFYVTVSTDVAANNVKDAFPHAKKHDRDLWGRATLEMLNQVTSLYGRADDFELISAENLALSSTDWKKDCHKYLVRLVPDWTEKQIDNLLGLLTSGQGSGQEASQFEKETFLQVLESLDVALEAFRQAKASQVISKRLVGKKMTIALYNGQANIMEACARLLASAVPAEYGLAWLPGHGAHTVHTHVNRMNLNLEDRTRLRLYSWIEVDSFMYTPQFPLTGLQENIDFASNPNAGQQSRGVLFNHWRSSENELSLLFVSQAAYAGIRSGVFGRQVLKPFWGIENDELLDQFLQKLEEVDVNASLNGFCYLPCWWEIDENKDMLVVKMLKIDDHTNDKRIQVAQEAIELLDRLIAQSSRSVGLGRMRFLRAVLQAGIAHHRCVTAMGRMAAYLQKVDRNALADDQRQHFQALGDAALVYANEWLTIMSEHCVDRGVEGNMVSYHHVVVGYIKGFQGLYGTIKHEAMPEYHLSTSVQAPPPLVDSMK